MNLAPRSKWIKYSQKFMFIFQSIHRADITILVKEVLDHKFLWQFLRLYSYLFYFLVEHVGIPQRWLARKNHVQAIFVSSIDFGSINDTCLIVIIYIVLILWLQYYYKVCVAIDLCFLDCDFFFFFVLCIFEISFI